MRRFLRLLWVSCIVCFATTGSFAGTCTDTRHYTSCNGKMVLDNNSGVCVPPVSVKVTLDSNFYASSTATSGTPATDAGTLEYYYQYKTKNPCYYYTDESLGTCIAGTGGVNVTVPTLAGYTFGGYYTGKTGTGTQYVNASGGTVNNLYNAVNSNITLYAKWTANTNGITLDANGATSGKIMNTTISSTSQTVTFTCTTGSSMSLPTWSSTDSATTTSIVKSNQVFKGWSETRGGSVVSVSTCPAGGKTYYAVWESASCVKGTGVATTTVNRVENNAPVCNRSSIDGHYCTATQTGTAGTASLTTSCSLADKGYFATAGSTVQTKCAQGSYTSTTGKSSCTPCSGGKTNSGTGNTACSTTCSNAGNVMSWETPVWNSNNTVSNLCTVKSCSICMSSECEVTLDVGRICPVSSCSSTISNNACVYTGTCSSGFSTTGGTDTGTSASCSGNTCTCSARTYEVPFRCGDGTGTAPSAQTATYGSNFTMPMNTCTAPTGYYFTGWIKKHYSWYKPGMVDPGGSRIILEIPIEAGTSFRWMNADWAVENPLVVEFLREYDYYEAVYEPKTYTVTYAAGIGGSGSISSATATYNSNFTPATPSSSTITKANATFAGWTVSGTSDTKIAGLAFKWTYTENKTFTATWTCNAGYYLNGTACDANTYTISYELAGGTHGSSHPTSAKYDAQFTVNNPTRSGYTFAGWDITGMDSVTHTYGSSTTTSTSISSTTATTFKNLRSTSGTVTFTAKWTANTNTITLNANGGTSGKIKNTAISSSSQTVTFTCTTASNMSLPTWSSTDSGSTTSIAQNNKVFKGWAESSGGSVVSVSTCPTGNKTYYAVWESASCTGDGTGVSSTTLKDVSGNAPRCNVSCTSNYSQSGGTDTTSSFTATGTAGTAAYKPVCKLKTNYTITIDKNGGSGTLTVNGVTQSNTTNVSVTCYHGNTVTLPSWSSASGTANNLTKSNSVFTGWDTTSPHTCTATKTIKANWGGTCAATGTGVSSTSVSSVSNNALVCSVNCNSASYSQNGGTDTTYSFNSTGTAGSGTHTPVCKAKSTYTVTYACGSGASGSAPASATATYDSNFTPSGNNTCAKTGYTFAGWNDGSADWTAGTAKKWTYTANKTFTAKWTANTNTITLNANGGTSGKIRNTTISSTSQTVTFTCTTASSMSLPTWSSTDSASTTSIAQSNKVFKGWAESNTGSVVSVSTCPTGNKTYYAVWESASCVKGTGVNSTSVNSVSGNAPVCNRSSTGGYYCSATQTGTAGTASLTTTCTSADAGYYAAAGAGSQTSCSTATSNKYKLSAAGSSSINDCYLTLTAGNYVATAGAGAVTCAAGGYCASTSNIYYGGSVSGRSTTGGRTPCDCGTYNSSNGSSTSSACKTTDAGYYASGTGNTTQTEAGVGKYAAAGACSATQCASGLTTIGYGTGADEVGDCGRKLHIGNELMYLRSARKTTPSLNVDIDNDGQPDFYANVSIGDHLISIASEKAFKYKDNGKTYFIYDDSYDFDCGIGRRGPNCECVQACTLVKNSTGTASCKQDNTVPNAATTVCPDGNKRCVGNYTNDACYSAGETCEGCSVWDACDAQNCYATKCKTNFYLNNGACAACGANSSANGSVNTCACSPGYSSNGTVTGSSTSTNGCSVMKLSCSAGQYVNWTSKKCESCPAGSYCPGGEQVYTSALKKYTCDNGFTTDGGASESGQCYRVCVTSDVQHSTAVTGNYYQSGEKTCAATSCESNYSLSGGQCKAK